MQLMFKEGEDFGGGVLFLTDGELNSEDFRILAETEFTFLSQDDKEALDFFIEEANERL